MELAVVNPPAKVQLAMEVTIDLIYLSLNLNTVDLTYINLVSLPVVSLKDLSSMNLFIVNLPLSHAMSLINVDLTLGLSTTD